MLERIARSSCYGIFVGLRYGGTHDWDGMKGLDCYVVEWDT